MRMHDYHLKLNQGLLPVLNLILILSLLSCNLKLIMETVTLGGRNKSGMRVRVSSEPLRGSVVQWQYIEISMAEAVDSSNLKYL